MQTEAVVASGLGVIADIAQQARERGNAIRLNDAEVQARRLRTRILLDPKTGVLNRQRQAAFDAPEVAGREWDAGVAEIAQTLAPDQRDAFRARAAQIRAEIEDQTFRHVRREMDVVDEETATALRDDLLAQIVQDAGSPLVEQALGRAIETERGLLSRKGLTPEAQERAIADLRSRARLAEITALAERNPSVARETLERYAEELRGKDKVDAQRLVRAGTMAVESQTARDTLIAEFPDSEADALKAVSDRYEGKMENVVRQRVEAYFADKRRLDAQVTNDLFNQLAVVAQTTGDLAPNQAELERLRERDPAKARRLEAYAKQTRTGRAAETDWEVWDRLTQMNTEQLRDINPLEYRSELADREYNALNRMVQRSRGTGEFAREQPGMTEAQLTNTAFEEAQRLELLPRNVTSARALKGEQGVRFTQLMDGVQAEIDRRVAEQNGRPLSRQQQREAIAAVYDDLVMEKVGIFGSRAVPRAMVTDPTRARELTPAEREDVQQGRIPRPIAGETREAYWNRLVQRGVSPDSATAFAMREINP